MLDEVGEEAIEQVQSRKIGVLKFNNPSPDELLSHRTEVYFFMRPLSLRSMSSAAGGNLPGF
jgi:hypothetical protein